MIKIYTITVPFREYSNKRITTKDISHQLQKIDSLRLRIDLAIKTCDFLKAFYLKKILKLEQKRLSDMIDERLKKFKPRIKKTNRIYRKIDYFKIDEEIFNIDLEKNKKEVRL